MRGVRIILCTRNGAAHLGEQLASFVAQTYPHWKLWVSDDHSDDETRAILNRFAQDQPGRVERVLTGPCRGSTANFLSTLCHPDLRGHTVALSDQDDVWRPDKLRRAVAALNQGQAEHRPRAYASGYFVCDRDLTRMRAAEPWSRGPSLQNAVLQNVMPGNTIVLDPAAVSLVQTLGVQEVPFHDWWIYLAMMACGGSVLIDHEPTVYYRQHDANVLGANHGLRALSQRVRSVTRGEYAGWVLANLSALNTMETHLTDEARHLLGCWLGQTSQRGPARIAQLNRLGVHRQNRFESGVFLGAAGLGLL